MEPRRVIVGNGAPGDCSRVRCGFQMASALGRMAAAINVLTGHSWQARTHGPGVGLVLAGDVCENALDLPTLAQLGRPSSVHPVDRHANW